MRDASELAELELDRRRRTVMNQLRGMWPETVRDITWTECGLTPDDFDTYDEFLEAIYNTLSDRAIKKYFGL